MVTKRFCDSCDKEIQEIVYYNLSLQANTSAIINTARELCKPCADKVRLLVTPQEQEGQR